MALHTALSTNDVPVEGCLYKRSGLLWRCTRYNPITGYVKLTNAWGGYRILGLGEFQTTFGTHIP